MGRTPDFSVRGTTGPAGVEGEGRAASFELPSPSLSSRQETRAAEALLREITNWVTVYAAHTVEVK